MNHQMITKVNAAPDWSQIPSFGVDCDTWNTNPGICMTQQICYSDEAIYIRQQVAEANIRAEYTDPLSMVCQDSCMEFFFSPIPGVDRYFNFEWNLNGCLYLGLCEDRYNAMRLVPKDAKDQFDFSSARTADGWELSYKIPLTFIRLFFPEFKLTSGAQILANCYKTGDLTVHPHYLTWNPVTSPNPDFHRPCDFGIMEFA